MSTPIPEPYVLLLTRTEEGQVGYPAVLGPDHQAVVSNFTGSDINSLNSASLIVVPSDATSEPLRIPVSSAVVINILSPLDRLVIVSLERSVADIPPILGNSQQIEEDLVRHNGDYGAWLREAVGPVALLTPSESRPVPPVDYSDGGGTESFYQETYGSVTVIVCRTRNPKGCPFIPVGPCK